MASDLPATAAVEQPVQPEAERRAEAAGERLTTRRRVPLAVVVIWAVFAVGLVAFIAFARVPLEAGWRQGRSMQVLDIWSLFVIELTSVAGPFVTPALITAIVILVLAGSLICLWLAMNVTNDPTPDQPD